jgi:hypothetical protein
MGGGNPNHDEKGRFTDGPSSGALPKGTGRDMTPEQQQTVKAYTSQAFARVNMMLRDGKLDIEGSAAWSPEDVGRLKQRIQSDIKAMDAAIAANVIGKGELWAKAVSGSPAELTLYRKARASTFGVKQVTEGMELENHAYVSTSRKREVAEKFRQMGAGKQYVMHITTTPRSRGIDASYVSLQNESEVILARKSKFRVTKVEPAVKGKPQVIHVTHIDPH